MGAKIQIKKEKKTKVIAKKATGSFVVQNDKGLHTRPCTELVKCTCGFQANIILKFQKNTVNAKSLLGILMLAAPKGAKVKVEAEGKDADKAVSEVLFLAKNKFNIKY